MPRLKKIIKKLLLFDEPKVKEEFIIKESETDVNKDDTHKKYSSGKEDSDREAADGKEGRCRKSSGSDKPGTDKKAEKKTAISKELQENLEYMKKKYSIPINGDIVLREFKINVKDKVLDTFIMFFDGMVDRKIIDQFILQPLMLLSSLDIKGDRESITSYVKNHLLPQNQLKVAENFEDVIDEVNFGGCCVFIEGIDIAYTADVKGWEHRGVERPNSELVLRGPQEGFNEVLRVNTALLRKILKDEDLIAENVTVGRRSKTPCSLLYIKDITNDSLVEEVRKRLENIKMDYVVDSGELEQMLEDSSFIPSPQIIATERPDRVASMLSEGKVAVVVHGSPFVLVMPVSMPTLLHSSEDAFVRFPYSNLLRFVRIFGVLMSLLLPGIYVAITNYHQEMIPTDLLFAIAASREKVPFPSVVEILIMELSFELIREAGIRIPGPIGPTLGIIGALILGQAAVAANIVSPILIIIVAVTGIGSFAIPTFSLAFAFRMLRFGYIILGATAGFLGITLGLFIHGLVMVSARSFGVPLMVPFAPLTKGIFADVITRGPAWMQEKRPDYLNTKNEDKQPDISRKWAGSKSAEEGDNEE